jgi:hypothetical protein
MRQILQILTNTNVRISTLVAVAASFATLFISSPAYAITGPVTINNEPSTSNNQNAQQIADNVVFTSIAISSDTSITINEPIDISSSTFGTPHFNVSLIAPVCNIDNNINMATVSHLYLDCTVINFNAKITAGGALLNSSQILPSTTTTQVNVESPNASIQQAINFSSHPLTSQPVVTTVSVGLGQYVENLVINMPVTLSGNDGSNPIGADPNAPTINGALSGANVITVNSGGVELDGLHLNGAVNGGSSNPSVSGIVAGNVNGLTIAHNTFDGFSGPAINTGASTNVTLTANAPTSQMVNFLSTTPTNAVVNGTAYVPVAAATSNLPAVLSIDQSATGVCVIDGSNNVTFQHAGTCVVDANQPGNAFYSAAAQVQQSFTVSPTIQTVMFTSTAPMSAVVGGSAYVPTATSTAGLSVAITVDQSSVAVCSIDSSGNVTFLAAGTCMLDANQSGNADFLAASQVQQSFVVNQVPVFLLNTPSLSATSGQAYTYIFVAIGTPTPTYSLAAGAPSWLLINPVTGVLSGTPPTGTTSFTYSVVATNSVGSTTTGPFTVTIPASGVLSQVQTLQSQVSGVGPGSSLLTKVDSVATDVAAPTPNDLAAYNALNAFINQVKAQTGKTLTVTLATEFISEAQLIEIELGY